MSLVGPRPIVEEEIAKYGPAVALYSQVLPGLTGLWQVSGRNDTTYRERVELDCRYIRAWTAMVDLRVLVKTVRVVLGGHGAY
jgi:lipopolysaccharide/colanic/teichoic acid biosynthesis glycosyltransferase